MPSAVMGGGSSALGEATATGLVITDASAAGLEVGPNGSTNPVLRVVDNVASQATGLSVTGNAAGSGVTLAALSSGSNEDITLTPKGTGVVKASTTGFQTSSDTWTPGQFRFQTGSSATILFNGTGSLKFPVNGVLSLLQENTTSGGTLRSPPTTPAQITADQNDYNPGGVSLFLRLSTDASRSLTGLTFTTTKQDGQLHYIVNVGAQPIVLVNESASSTAANRFHNTTGADITLSADQQAMCWYDGTAARWRCTKQN